MFAAVANEPLRKGPTETSRPQLTPEQSEVHRQAIRILPLVALRAMRRSVRDPDDTAQAVRMLGALAGRSIERVMSRFLQMPGGAELMARTPKLLDVLVDREGLSKLPQGSFGRVYLAWLEREQISAEGLVTASEAAAAGEGEREGPYFVLGCRMRDMHDLLHVITGYGRDLVGEVGVLAFTFAQTWHTGIGFLLVVAWVRSFFPRSDQPYEDSPHARASIRRHLFDGYRRGRRADWIVGADWETLLALPIDEVRRRYRIPDPPLYRELRTSGAPVRASREAHSARGVHLSVSGHAGRQYARAFERLSGPLLTRIDLHGEVAIRHRMLDRG